MQKPDAEIRGSLRTRVLEDINKYLDTFPTHQLIDWLCYLAEEHGADAEAECPALKVHRPALRQSARPRSSGH